MIMVYNHYTMLNTHTASCELHIKRFISKVGATHTDINR